MFQCAGAQPCPARRGCTGTGTAAELSLPVGALAYVLVRVVHRRFTEENA